MKDSLRILYLKDQTSLYTLEEQILEEKYQVHTVQTYQELQSTLAAFIPHVLLCDIASEISPKDVLRSLDDPWNRSMIIFSVCEGRLQNLLPLLETAAENMETKESERILFDEQKEIQERYKSVYENSLDGILVTQPDGTILAANPAACKMLEMTEEEICTAGRDVIVDREDPRLAVAISQREHSGKAHTELTFIKKSGKKFPVELTSAVFRDACGNLKTTAIVRDITKRKQAEEQLKESHNSYKTIFYHSPIPYWIYDQDTLEIVDVNEMALQTYGYSSEEFLNLNILDLRPGVDIPHLQQHLEETAGAKGIKRHGKFNHLRKDGTPIKVEIFGYQFKFGDRNCRLVASLDITEKEEAAAKLEQKQLRLAAAQEMAKIGYYELEVDNYTFFLSDMMYKIWGVNKEDFDPTCENIWKTIHPEDRENFMHLQKSSIEADKIHDLEYRIVQPSGEIKWIHERGRILTWKDGKPVTVERTVQDITEEKKFLAQLARSESRYKGIVLSQTNYLIRTDMEGNYTYYNDKFFSDFGWLYDDREINGKPSLSSIMEYHHQAVIDLVARCIMDPGKAFQLEIDKPEKKGGVRTTLWDFVCLVDSYNNPVEIQCVGIDISDRVIAERQLKDSRLRYKLITQATSDAIWDWNLISGNLIWGKSFHSMFGYDPHDFHLINSWENILHPDDKQRTIEDLNDAIAGDSKKWSCEYRLRKNNGDYAHVIDRGSILRDKEGKAYRAVGSIQDITERKKLEDLLEKANSLSRIGSFELDLVRENLYWSPMIKEIHGVKEDFNPTLENAIKFYRKGKHRNRLIKFLRKAIEKKEAFDGEFQIVSAAGEVMWVRVMAQPEFENAKCVRISGSFQDINKIKTAELNVLQAAREKETLLESIGDAFFAVNEDWTVTYWNEHAVSLLNCPKQEILNKNLMKKFPDAASFASQLNFAAARKDKSVRQFEAYLERTDIWLEVHAYPSHEGLSVFLKDITQRKKADVKLRELNKSLRVHTRELVTANKGLEQFSYIVSHNLRSPVANIIGLAELLKTEEYPPEVREQFFDEIFSNVERLDSVVRDLNGILQAKVDIKARKEKIDLQDLVNGINCSIQNLIKEEKATIKYNFGEVTHITTVRTYLHSIFYNLIVNAIKYKKPDVPPEIEITTATKGDFFIISFSDNGLGIDLSTKADQIFNLYKRFHHHVEGKGMGLFMVKTQVDMLGGKITLNSKVNEGTTFRIFLKEKPLEIEVENETTLSISRS